MERPLPPSPPYVGWGAAYGEPLEFALVEAHRWVVLRRRSLPYRSQVSMVGAGRCGGKKIFKNREGRLNLLNLMNEILLLQKMEKETFEG